MVIFLLSTMITNRALMVNKSRAIIPPTTPRTIGSSESDGCSCLEVDSAVSGGGSVVSEARFGVRYAVDTRTVLDTIAAVLMDAMVG